MSSYKMLKNRKGVIGETITWFPAIIVVIGVIIAFIIFSVLISKLKNISVADVRTDLPEESQILETKTSLAHQILNNKNKEIIDAILKDDDK